MLVFVSDIMLHSRAPRMIPLPTFGSCSSDFGAFMFIRSKCGCNMYAKMLSGFLITSSIHAKETDLGNEYKYIFHKYECCPSPSVDSHPPCFSFIWCQLSNSCTVISQSSGHIKFSQLDTCFFLLLLFRHLLALR